MQDHTSMRFFYIAVPRGPKLSNRAPRPRVSTTQRINSGLQVPEDQTMPPSPRGSKKHMLRCTAIPRRPSRQDVPEGPEVLLSECPFPCPSNPSGRRKSRSFPSADGPNLQGFLCSRIPCPTHNHLSEGPFVLQVHIPRSPGCRWRRGPPRRLGKATARDSDPRISKRPNGP